MNLGTIGLNRWRGHVPLFFLFLFLLPACIVTPPLPVGVLPPDRQSYVIAFGSCANQSKQQLIWDAVVASQPDLFIFLGDNIYGDTEDMNLLRARYDQLARNPHFQRLRAQTPIIATWDDHDYGANDAGAEFPKKVESKEIFLDFFGEPPNTERRLRADGIYTAYRYGAAGQRIQVLLLDTRWARSPLLRVSDAEYAERRRHHIGPYTANTDPDARILSEAQWRWLEEQLRQPAELRLIATSIPFLQEGTGWETWSNFPAEQERLLALIEQTRANGLLFLTGDTHRAQFSKRAEGVPYPLWEVNSSGLTENVEWPAPDASRLGGYYMDDNYGLVRVDWSEDDPEITLEIRAADNDLVLQNTIRLSELQIAE
jgi:alkaline phosphatase D